MSTSQDILDARQAFERVYGMQQQALKQWQEIATQVEEQNALINASDMVVKYTELTTKANEMAEIAQRMTPSVQATWNAYQGLAKPGKPHLSVAAATEDLTAEEALNE